MNSDGGVRIFFKPLKATQGADYWERKSLGIPGSIIGSHQIYAVPRVLSEHKTLADIKSAPLVVESIIWSGEKREPTKANSWVWETCDGFRSMISVDPKVDSRPESYFYLCEFSELDRSRSVLTALNGPMNVLRTNNPKHAAYLDRYREIVGKSRAQGLLK